MFTCRPMNFSKNARQYRKKRPFKIVCGNAEIDRHSKCALLASVSVGSARSWHRATWPGSTRRQYPSPLLRLAIQSRRNPPLEYWAARRDRAAARHARCRHPRLPLRPSPGHSGWSTTLFLATKAWSACADITTLTVVCAKLCTTPAHRLFSSHMGWPRTVRRRHCRRSWARQTDGMGCDSDSHLCS